MTSKKINGGIFSVPDRGYEEPHPDPWCHGGYFEAQIRHRFKCFEGEPWFKQLVISYCDWCDKDGGEYPAEEILKSLEETAKLQGIEIIPRECGDCEEPKDDVTADNRVCSDCQRLKLEAEWEARQAKARREERRAKMTPEQREQEDKQAIEAMRVMVNGLMTRDVQ